jgi:hypothetical protein
MRSIVVAVLLCLPVFAQNGSQSNRSEMIKFAVKSAVSAVNFKQGDLVGFNSARAEFTVEGWNDFIHHNEGFLDQNGAPTFTSTFMATADARILGDANGRLHLRIPGTLTQSNNISKTTYRAVALDVVVGSTPAKIEKLEQVMCAGPSPACK